jgi:hypothetical protein
VAKLDSNFYQKLLQLSAKVGMKPEDILNVMAVESGLDPSAHNPHGGASGLVQVMPKFLSGLGFKGTPEEFRKTPASSQLDVVERLIQNMMKINGGPLTSAAHYYVGIFLPVALKLQGVRQGRPDTIIVSKNPTEPHLPNISIQKEKIFYNANPGLDFDHDGNITFGDIQNVLKVARNKKAYQNAVSELSKFRGSTPNESVFDKFLPSKPKANNVNRLLDNYLALINAEEEVKMKKLSYNSAVVKIVSNSFNESLEFARLLTLALDEELSAKVSIHSNNNLVEVECDIPGAPQEVFAVAEQLSNSLAEVFFDVTKKIGGVTVKTQLITNKKSSYQTVDLKTAESEHRKFLLKFI